MLEIGDEYLKWAWTFFRKYHGEAVDLDVLLTYLAVTFDRDKSRCLELADRMCQIGLIQKYERYETRGGIQVPIGKIMERRHESEE